MPSRDETNATELHRRPGLRDPPRAECGLFYWLYIFIKTFCVYVIAKPPYRCTGEHKNNN